MEIKGFIFMMLDISIHNIQNTRVYVIYEIKLVYIKKKKNNYTFLISIRYILDKLSLIYLLSVYTTVS